MRIRFRIFQLVIIPVTFLFNSCNPIFYAPNAQNVPLFINKHDYTISGHYTEGEDLRAYEGQFAYAIDSSLAMQFNFLKTIVEEEYVKGSYGEFALGYFNEFDKNWVFEVYGGLGFGQVDWKLKSFSSYGYYNGQVSFYKAYAQTNLGYKNQFIKAAFSTKIGAINFSGAFPMESTQLVLEPALTMALGYRAIKVQGQLGASRPILNKEFIRYQEPINANLAILLQLSKW